MATNTRARTLASMRSCFLEDIYLSIDDKSMKISAASVTQSPQLISPTICQDPIFVNWGFSTVKKYLWITKSQPPHRSGPHNSPRDYSNPFLVYSVHKRRNLYSPRGLGNRVPHPYTYRTLLKRPVNSAFSSTSLFQRGAQREAPWVPGTPFLSISILRVWCRLLRY